MKRLVVIFVGIVLFVSIWACSSLYVSRDHFIQPLPTKLIVRNDDYGDGYFGAKRSGGRQHNGIDYLADIGTPVFAAKSGTVKFARYKKGNGKYVVLNHRFGYKTYYCHLLNINVREGKKVREGQLIGVVGKTGNANRAGMLAHLHFEVHKNGAPFDPGQIVYSGGQKYASNPSRDKSI